MKSGRLLVILGLVLVVVVVLFLIPGGESHELDVAEEFALHPIVHLPSVGPVDLSVNKAVVYLWISFGVICLLAWGVNRTVKTVPGRFQFAMETLYELARENIVGSVMKSGRKTWFPYIAGVFFFVLVNNLVGLVPLPFAEHGNLGFYAATANLYVTLSLALCTFVFTHYAGVRKNGVVTYMRNWAPASAPPVLRQLIWVIHAGQRGLPRRLALRPSLRQHARRARDPRRVLRHGAALPELRRRCRCCRAAPS